MAQETPTLPAAPWQPASPCSPLQHTIWLQWGSQRLPAQRDDVFLVIYHDVANLEEAVGLRSGRWTPNKCTVTGVRSRLFL